MRTFSGYEQERPFMDFEYRGRTSVLQAVLYSIHYLANSSFIRIAEMQEGGEFESGYGYDPEQVALISTTFNGYQKYYGKMAYLNPHQKLQKLVEATTQLNPSAKTDTGRLPITSLTIGESRHTEDIAAVREEKNSKVLRLPVTHTLVTPLKIIGWGAGRKELAGILSTSVYHLISRGMLAYIAEPSLSLESDSRKLVEQVSTNYVKYKPRIAPWLSETGRQTKSTKLVGSDGNYNDPTTSLDDY